MQQNLNALLGAIERLPTAPAVAQRIVVLLRQVHLPRHALARALACDPALTARVIQFANTSNQGRCAAATSPSQTVSLLDARDLRLLALSYVPLLPEQRAACPSFDPMHFWRRSLARAVAAEDIARQTGCAEPGAAYTLGLLYRIGSLVLATCHPHEYEAVLRQATATGELPELETKHFGLAHVELAAQLLARWRFPRAFHEAVYGERDPNRVSCESTPVLAGVLATAERCADLLVASASSRAAQSKPAPEIADGLGGSIHPAQWPRIFARIELRWRDASKVLDLAENEARPLVEIEVEARRQLAELATAMHSEHRAAQADKTELLRLARTDPLTKVGNRPAFDERLDLELQRARRTSRPVALLLVDVDRFKAVNDRCGHAAGDAVLCGIARAIEQATRAVDHVSRYGGDEFAVIAPECTLEGAASLAERLRCAVEQLTIPWQDDQLNVTISIGAAFAHWPQRPASPGQLAFAADEQLYAAKHAGRNCCKIQQLSGQCRSHEPDCATS